MAYGYGFPQAISFLSFLSSCFILTSHYCNLGNRMVGDWGEGGAVISHDRLPR